MPSHSSILPGESRGQRNLVDYGPWGRKELGMIEQLSTQPIESPVLVNRGLEAGTGRRHVEMEQRRGQASMGVPEPLILPRTAGGEGGSNRLGPWPPTSGENTWPGSWSPIPTPDAWAASSAASGVPVPGGSRRLLPALSTTRWTQGFPRLPARHPFLRGSGAAGVLGGLSFSGCRCHSEASGEITLGHVLSTVLRPL